MKILLINPNPLNKWAKPPLGLLSIGTICKKAGHEVAIWDAGIDLRPIDERFLMPSYSWAENVLGEYDVIGITAMTVQIDRALNIAQFLKKRVDKPLIIGGVHASIFPQQLYDTRLFDAVVVGEGEESILSILNDIKNISPIYETEKPVAIPILDYSLIDISAYKPRYPHGIRSNWTTAQTSRGCPYSCTFCCNIFGHKYRYMPVEDVITMLWKLCYEHDVRDITFYDDEFTLNKERVLELCTSMATIKFDLTWSCESRVDMLDMELLEVMKRAGCRLIYLGIESGNQAILDKLNKRISLQQVMEAVSLIRKAGIQAAGYFMLGCPGETKQTMQETIFFASELQLDHAQFSVCSPLPGTALFKENGGNYNWNEYQYLANVPKVICDTELAYEEIEEAVNQSNLVFSK